jgi:hypothetical protein
MMMIIIRKPKHPPKKKKNKKTKKQRKNTRNKMAGPTFKKTNESHEKANHKRNIKFSNPLQLLQAYQIRKGNLTHKPVQQPLCTLVH